MICLTKQDGTPYWLAIHHLIGMEPAINGTHVFYGKNCITVQDTPAEILAMLP